MQEQEKRQWGLRYSLFRGRDEKIVGTVMVRLDDVPKRKSAQEVADAWCAMFRPECKPMMPRAVVLDGDALPVNEPDAIAAA